jgi:hypothetical protein
MGHLPGSKIRPCPSLLFSMLSSNEICCQIVSWKMPENTRMAFQRETKSEHFVEGDNRHDATQLSNRERHMMLWDSIFSDYKWIDGIVRDFSARPFLVGTRLDAFHLGNKDNSKPLYAALISGDISGDVTYTKDLFISCLRPHKPVEGTDEVLFDSGILLNIGDILNCPELIPVDIQQLCAIEINLIQLTRSGETSMMHQGVSSRLLLY